MFWNLNGRRGWLGYVAAALLTASAVIVRLELLQPLGTRVTYLTFYPAVTLAAAYGGFFPGLTASVLSAGSACLLLLEPTGTLTIAAPEDMLGLAVFLVSCVIISLTGETLLRDQIRLRDSQADLQTKSLLLDSSYDYIMVKELDCRIIYWNQGAEKGYGFSAAEARGQIAHQLLQTEFPLSSEALIAELLGRDHWEGELIHIRKDGTRIIVQSSQTLNRDETGAPISIMEINRDITRQKAAEKMVIETNLRLLQFNAQLENTVAERTQELQNINAALEEEIMERQAVQEELRNLNAQLEIKILERTRDLEDINAALEEEIMERSKAEERIRNQAELLDLAHDFILVRNMNNQITYWNQGAAAGYGFTAAEALGQSAHNLLKTRFPQPLDHISEDLLKNGYWEGELIHTCKDGRQVIVKSHWTVSRDEAGAAWTVLEINHDITAQKNAEAALMELNQELENKVAARTKDLQEINAALEEEVMERQAAQEALIKNRDLLIASEARYRELFANMENVFIYYKVHFDEEGCPVNLEFAEVNAAFEKRMGLTRAAVAGQYLTDVCFEQELDCAQWIKPFGEVALTGRQFTRETCLNKSGAYLRLSAYSPETGYVAVIIEDITEKKRAEEALRQSQEWYEAIMKQSSEAIAVIDFATERIIEINQAFSRTFGYSADEAASAPASFLGLLTPEEITVLAAALKNGGSWSAKLRRYPRKDGQAVYAEMAAALMNYRNKQQMILSYRDVTEQQKLQAEIQDQVELAGIVQTALLPPDYHSGNLMIRAIYQPLSLVSGDFYGYRQTQDGKLLHGYLIDVTGHGIAAALYTSAISSLVNEMMDAEEAWTLEKLYNLNRHLTSYFPDDTFVALLAFTFDFRRKLLTCTSGGINYMLISSQNRTQLMTLPGIYLGITAKPDFDTVTIPFRHGDAFYFMTDGIYENLPKNIADQAGDFETTIEALKKVATKGRSTDDCTALCVKIPDIQSFPLSFDFSRPKERGRVQGGISQILREIAGEQTGKIEVALGEALMNAARHGTKVRVKINKIGSQLILRVKDDGPGFPGNAKLREYQEMGLEQVFDKLLLQDNGRGLPVMLVWTDKVLYNSQGNEVMLVKNLFQPAGS